MTATPDRNRAMTGNVIKLNIFAALKMMLFPMAIITVFWKDHIGLSLSEILLVNVFFSTANLVMEYPSGYVSDRLGYRKALVLACCSLLPATPCTWWRTRSGR